MYSQTYTNIRGLFSFIVPLDAIMPCKKTKKKGKRLHVIRPTTIFVGTFNEHCIY